MKIFPIKLSWVLALCFTWQWLPLMSYDDLSKNCEAVNERPDFWLHEIRNRIIKKYTEKYGLTVAGIVTGMPEGIIHEVGVYFNIYHVISKQKSRKIVVECVQDFTAELNNHPQLRSYLKEYPCTANNIDIAVFIYHPDGQSTCYPDLIAAGAYNGFVTYKTKDPQKEFGYKTEEKETFEEAVERVKVETPKEDLR